jgi:hypothetical protein
MFIFFFIINLNNEILDFYIKFYNLNKYDKIMKLNNEFYFFYKLIIFFNCYI